MKSWHFLFPALVIAGISAGCSKPDPAAQCGTSDAQSAYLEIIYSGLSGKRERAEGALGDRFAAKAHDFVKALKAVSPISFGAITAEHYDPATGNLDCRVEVKIKPTGDFATQSVRGQAAEMEHLRQTSVFPDGFFDARAAPISAIFELRHDANGKQTVHGAASFDEILRVADELLNARSLSDAVLAANPGRDPNYKVIDAETQKLPTVGQCFESAVHDVGYRLEGIFDSGTSVTFDDGHSMVSYETDPNASNWQTDDRVKLCVVSLPTNCPKDDNRGVVYRATNIRARNEWTAGDSEHECGGA